MYQTVQKRAGEKTGRDAACAACHGRCSAAKKMCRQGRAADYDSYVQMQYGKEEGLLSGEANDIAQTKDGKLWIGTYAGLFSYDGTRFKLLQNIDSVKNVNCLYVDEEGRLWVGTNDDGVTILINEHVMNVLDEENGLLSDSVKSIVCDSGRQLLYRNDGGTFAGIFKQWCKGNKIIQTDPKCYGYVSGRERACCDRDGKREDLLAEGRRNCQSPQGSMQDKPLRAVCFADELLLTATEDDQIRIYQMENDQMKLVQTIVMDGIEEINSFYMTEEK